MDRPATLMGQPPLAAPAWQPPTDSIDNRNEPAMLSDRERIAFDLNDLVIKRIFSVGLWLQATAARADDAQLALRIQNAIDELDGVISDIRTTVFSTEGHGSR